jgi:hypothetical protein
MSPPEPVQPIPPALPGTASPSGSAEQSRLAPAPGTEPFLSLHTTVVLLAAAVIGLVIAALTVLSGAHPATAAIAALTATGASTTVLRTLIG